MGEVVVILLIAVALFVIFKLTGTILKFVLGIIINSVLGLIAIFALNSFLGLGLMITGGVLIAVALFGLPAVGTIVILHSLNATAP